MRPAVPTRVPFFLISGLLLLVLAGCASEDREADTGGRPRRPAVAPLAGQQSYFDGKVEVAINVGAMEGLGEMRGEGGRGGEGDRAGGGGGRRHRGGGGMGGGGYGGREGGEREGGGERPEGGGRPMRGAGGPPQMIHIKFTNHGSKKIVVNIVDFVSPFGNFAVQPETLTLEPGQSVETEPMSSQLAGALTEADATLVLRVSGRAEKKVVVLRAATPTPAAAK